MKLIPNAGKVLKKSSSIKFIGGSVLLQIVATAIPYFMDYIPSGPLQIGAIAVTAAAGVARVIKQQGLGNDE